MTTELNLSRRSSSSSVEFYFRLWVHPDDGDPPEIEVWWHGIEDTSPNKIFVSDWVRDSLAAEDFYKLFGLDRSKHWQIVGTAKLRGWFDSDGEYDEDLTIETSEMAEVPSSWFDDMEPTA